MENMDNYRQLSLEKLRWNIKEAKTRDLDNGEPLSSKELEIICNAIGDCIASNESFVSSELTELNGCTSFLEPYVVPEAIEGLPTFTAFDRNKRMRQFQTRRMGKEILSRIYGVYIIDQDEWDSCTTDEEQRRDKIISFKKKYIQYLHGTGTMPSLEELMDESETTIAPTIQDEEVDETQYDFHPSYFDIEADLDRSGWDHDESTWC